MRERDHVARLAIYTRDVEERVDRDTTERHAQLGPGRDAVNIAGIGRSGKGVDLFPSPSRRASHQTLDGERPRVHIEMWCDLCGKNGPLVPRVVLTRWQSWITRGL